MRRQDWLGNEVTLGDEATLAGIDAFSRGFLAYTTEAADILPAAAADPDSPLANAYAAMAWLFLESPEGPLRAAAPLARAEAAAARGTEHERAVIAAVRAWADNDIPRALALGEDAAVRFPRELALAKATQYHHFNRGDAAGMLRVARAVLPHHRTLGYAHGLLAFACEQSHMMREAESAARTALDLQPREPWAQHALAHVMLTEGRIDEGRAFMEAASPGWDGLNSFMLTHNWWHLALFMIDQGEGARVLAIFPTRIWGVWKEYSQDQIGAVSLLARLELAGIDVGERWQDVAGHLAARVHDHVQPFLDLQYLYGLARAGRPEADAMLESLRKHAARAPAFCRAAWTEVALPAAEALVAHARGDWAAATALLAVLPRLNEIGGSHAQRDLFDQIADDALLRAGRTSLALDRLARRHAATPRAEPVRARLASLYAQLGLPEDAARLTARSPSPR
jgi:hypothetical protein